MDNLEKIPPAKDGWSDFQKKYNTASKNIVNLLGTNITLFICILLPILLIGFIWTDFGMVVVAPKLISDGIVTVLMFIIGEMMMMKVGADGGKLDLDYVATKKEFRSLVEKVNEIGTMFMPVFCEMQIDTEMEQALTARLRALRISRKDWDKYKDIPFKQLKQDYGLKRARKINEARKLEPIELNESILLYDSDLDALSRGGVPISGDGYMRKKTHSFEMILSCLFMGFLTVSVAITLTDDFSFARVMYTAFKVIILLFRMARGYERGARAYHTVETRQYQAKSNFLRLYIRFVEEKTYLKLGDKYEDLLCYINEDNDIPTITNE